MSRVVVIGPYPPTADPQGDVTLGVVRRLRAEGASVTVVSPVPSAAPDHGDPSTWVGARRVARVVRGADRVVWFGGPGDRAVALPLRRALATVPRVEARRTVATADPSAADPRPRAGVRRLGMERLRAGGPTFLRTVVERVRRALRPACR